MVEIAALALLAAGALATGYLLPDGRFPLPTFVAIVLILVAAVVLGRRGRSRRDWVALAVAGPVAAVLTIFDSGRGNTATIVLLLAVAGPWALSRVTVRERQAAEMARDRALLAVETESARWQLDGMRRHHRHAAHLHDTIGHDLALLAISASRVEVDERLPEDVRLLGRRIRGLAADSTAHLSNAIAILDRDQPTREIDTIETIDAIVERARVAGMVVHYEIAHADSLDTRDIEVAATIVRESLTNAAKHAPGQEVRIDGRVSDESVEMSIRNRTGQCREARRGGSGSGGSGSGLAALRDIVASRSGTLVVDRTPDFTVTAQWCR